MEYKQVAPELKIGCETDEHNRLIFGFDGSLEVYNSNASEKYIDDILKFKPESVGDDHQVIVLDLQKLSFVDSSGLKSILILNKTCEKAGYTLTIRNPSDTAMYLLELIDIEDIIEIEFTTEK